jgi:hypothetical protein
LPDRYRAWRRLASLRWDGDLVVLQDVLERISTMLAIHAGIGLFYPGDDLGWLRGPFDTPPFDGRAPLYLTATCLREDLRAVLGWLVATGQGAPIPSTDNEPHGIYVSVDVNEFADQLVFTLEIRS